MTKPAAAGRPLDLAGRIVQALVDANRIPRSKAWENRDTSRAAAASVIREVLAASRPGEPSATSVERYDHATAVHAQEREREYRRTLWAAAATVHPQPLRVAQCCRDNYAPDCELQTRTDMTTGDLLIYAPAPPKDADQ